MAQVGGRGVIVAGAACVLLGLAGGVPLIVASEGGAQLVGVVLVSVSAALGGTSLVLGRILAAAAAQLPPDGAPLAARVPAARPQPAFNPGGTLNVGSMLTSTRIARLIARAPSVSFLAELRAASEFCADDPDVALTRCRKILEAVLHGLYRAKLGDPAKRDLNALIAGLSNTGHLPRKVLALTQIVRELGNVGSHPIYDDEELSHREAHLSVGALTIILEWYVRTQVETATATSLAGAGAGATLTITQGKDRGKTFLIAPGSRFLIGRGLGCDCRLDDQGASEMHALFGFDGDEPFVQDQDSRNGVFVNREKVERRTLRSGDSLQIGQTTLVVGWEPARPPSSAEA